MSCVSFGGRGWLERLRVAADDPRPVAEFLSPEHSESKVRRIRLLAVSSDPVIRESAALSYLAPVEVLTDLANDKQVGVRCCVARNHSTPVDVLERLSHDPDTGVRGWVAANPSTPAPVLAQLRHDPQQSVRTVATWATPTTEQQQTVTPGGAGAGRP